MLSQIIVSDALYQTLASTCIDEFTDVSVASEIVMLINKSGTASCKAGHLFN